MTRLLELDIVFDGPFPDALASDASFGVYIRYLGALIDRIRPPIPLPPPLPPPRKSSKPSLPAADRETFTQTASIALQLLQSGFLANDSHEPSNYLSAFNTIVREIPFSAEQVNELLINAQNDYMRYRVAQLMDIVSEAIRVLPIISERILNVPVTHGIAAEQIERTIALITNADTARAAFVQTSTPHADRVHLYKTIATAAANAQLFVAYNHQDASEPKVFSEEACSLPSRLVQRCYILSAIADIFPNTTINAYVKEQMNYFQQQEDEDIPRMCTSRTEKTPGAFDKCILQLVGNFTTMHNTVRGYLPTNLQWMLDVVPNN